MDEHGRPRPPEVTTCPLSDDPVEPGTEASLDRSALEESAAHIPRSQPAPVPSQAPPAAGSGKPAGKAPKSRTVSARASALQLDLLEPPVDNIEAAPTDPNPTAGRCATCQAWVDVGKGHLLAYTPSNVLQCDRCHGAETGQGP